MPLCLRTRGLCSRIVLRERLTWIPPAGANILDYIDKNTNIFINNNNRCIQYNRHIGIYQSESGASNMAFAGYGNPANADYMIYPAPSSNTRTFSFNIDASVINTHTLTGFGFLMNAGIVDEKVSGYLLYFNANSAASGIMVFDEGVTEPTEFKGGEAFRVKAAHKFIAMWTPRDDTKYTVEYYINSGRKNDQGSFIYTKVNAETKTYTAATESEAEVKEADVAAELTVSEVKYWYNAENTGNVLKGKVTGNPALALKLYYDRYFAVTATQKGEGTVTGATDVKEGTAPTVSWRLCQALAAVRQMAVTRSPLTVTAAMDPKPSARQLPWMLWTPTGLHGMFRQANTRSTRSI